MREADPGATERVVGDVPAAGVALVIFDLGGTTVDHGCLAPVEAFRAAFAAHGVPVTESEVRSPMGLHKRDHIQAILCDPDVAARWKRFHGRSWNADDLARLYAAFEPLQLDLLDDHSRLVPGLLEVVDRLRSRNLLIATTTGFFRAAAERVWHSATEQGFLRDADVCADDVPAGRPHPYMIRRLMRLMQVARPESVVKVGDTIHDVAEGAAAGTWTVGVTASGSEVGLTAAALTALPPHEVNLTLSLAEDRLTTAGADFVIDTLAELPALIETIEARLEQGDLPRQAALNIPAD